jgi:hypothetical protein
MVKAIVPGGKYKGIHYGFVATRSSGSFDIKNGEGKRMAQGVHYRHYQLVQRFDGNVYLIARREVTNRAILPKPKGRGLLALFSVIVLGNVIFVPSPFMVV